MLSSKNTTYLSMLLLFIVCLANLQAALHCTALEYLSTNEDAQSSGF